MSHAHSASLFHRGALMFCGGAVMISIVAAAVGRLTGAANDTPVSTSVVSRDLLFRDRADGAVAVYDARNVNVPIDIVAPASNGFLRATMRGLARQRLREDADRETPFRLTEWADGRLTLDDPATGRHLEMEAFGIDNERAFANLLTAKAGS